METGCWNLFGAGNGGGGGRGYNGNFTSTTHACDIWQLGSSSRYDWINTHHPPTTTTLTADVSAIHALLHHQGSPSVSYPGAGPPDPQLTMCLKLGKRHYFEDYSTIPFGERHVEGTAVGKRGRVVPYYGYGDESTTGVTVAAPPPPPPAVAVPRCQVEGCVAALLNAKDYHRRHKVCVMHSKAPKVNVNGIEQRFCQQCSRFHEVSEFDETKRSCRRRLAGHNERRRKTSSHHHLLHGRFSSTTTGHALSLLSSENNDQHWKILSPSDLSSRCSDALRELIAENRAYSSNLSKHQLFIPDKANHTFTEEPFTENQNNTSHNSQLFNDNHDHQILHDHYADSWGRFNEEAANPNVTLNLAPASAFEILSMRGKSSKDKSEECSDVWSSLGGTHVV